jgi:DNA repair exonuclease SbcCD ATPase subunit
MATLDEIRATIESYPPVLTSGALMRVAEKEGWVEDRSEGGHRVFIYPDEPRYGHITFKCHQEGQDCNRIVTRRRLTEIYQPAIDRASEDADQQERLRQTINQLESVLAQCEADFSLRAHRKLEELQRRIEQYESDCLEECEQTMQRFVDDCQQGSLAEKEQELQQIRQELGLARQQVEQLEGKERSLQGTLAIAQQKVSQLQTELNTVLASSKQQKERDYAQNQIAALKKALQEKEAQIELTNSQAHSRFVRFKRRMITVCFVLLGLVGALTVRACFSATFPIPR